MQQHPSILFADNDPSSILPLVKELENDGKYQIVPFDNTTPLPDFLKQNSFDVIIVDLDLAENMTASLKLVNDIRDQHKNSLLIAAVGEENEDLVRLVTEMDVFFYVEKPYNINELMVALKRAGQTVASRQNRRQSATAKTGNTFHGIIGNTRKMQQLFDLITKVAEDAFSTVLILGESGTGKELVAKAIHSHSSRSNHHFVPVNCAAIPDDLLESELFGYAKGAFTGATQNKIGRVQYADGGTLFLDEIGDMKPALQAKLLRVLQEKEFEPVGGLKASPVDTRVVAATHCDLEQLVNEGKFREDLYYRLSVIPITIPPLKERWQDIPLLLQAFVDRYSTRRNRKPFTFSKRVTDALMKHDWKGNVRELENLVQHMSILYAGQEVQLSDLPEKYIVDYDPASVMSSDDDVAEMNSGSDSKGGGDTPSFSWEDGQVDFKQLINDFEKQLIIEAMRQTGGNKKEAARLLNLKRTTLLEKIKKKDLNGLWELPQE